MKKPLLTLKITVSTGAYGAYSDIVTIRMKITNWGETDAAPCVLTDVLWDGLEYVGCTVTGDDGVTGSAAVNGDEITVYIGEGAEDGRRRYA